MGTISQKLTYLEQTKTAIGNAIAAKGGSVTGKTFRQYATEISNLPSGGGNQDLIDLIEKDITTFSIPSGTTKIGNYAFYSCSSLTSVTIPNSVTSIGDYTFYGCSGLTSVTIPNSVTSIGDSAFYFTRLSSVTIQNGSIGARCFSNIKSLTSVTIGSGVTAIGENAFQSDSNLSSVYISDLVSWCNINFGYEGNPLKYASHLYLNGTEINDLVIPNSVTTIKYMAFYNFKGLNSVTIHNGVTSIGNASFTGCTNLTSITVEATTPPTLANSNAFTNTNNCPIYVPAESVEAYKAASGWSSYASRIQAIPSE